MTASHFLILSEDSRYDFRGSLTLEQVNEIPCSGRWKSRTGPICKVSVERGSKRFAIVSQVARQPTAFRKHGHPIHHEDERFMVSQHGSFIVSRTHADPDHYSCMQLVQELPTTALPEAVKVLRNLRDHYRTPALPMGSVALPTPLITTVLFALPDPRYQVIQPIPIHLEQEAADNWTASFEEANISMSGTSLGDAAQALADDIGYALDLLLSERDTLSPALLEELSVLERYVKVRE